jgi:hypothetical protein
VLALGTSDGAAPLAAPLVRGGCTTVCGTVDIVQ